MLASAASAAHHHHHKVYFAPTMHMGPSDLGLGFADKRNRNPNWTDHEIIRFLEILQEEKVLKDLMAQRNKQVFCYVAQRMTSEGSEKTWDQCRIKLKNLKSQYRYVKDRIPNIDEVDLDDDEVLKQLISECQGRGISPSNIKHLRYLRRFLQKTSDHVTTGHFKSPSLDLSRPDSNSMPPHPGSSSSRPPGYERSSPFMRTSEHDSENLIIDDHESVSPPSTPLSSGVRLVHHGQDEPSSADPGSIRKRRKMASLTSSSNSQYGDLSELLTGSTLDGYRFIEKFNRDMMDQFMDYQRRVAASQTRWEQERYRQEQLAIEQWRSEAREHERQMFNIFCGALSHCNAALNILLKGRHDAQDCRTGKSTESSGSDGRPSSQSTDEKSPSSQERGDVST